MMRRTVERVRMRSDLANSDLNTTDRDKVGLACILTHHSTPFHSQYHTPLSRGALV